MASLVNIVAWKTLYLSISVTAVWILLLMIFRESDKMNNNNVFNEYDSLKEPDIHDHNNIPLPTQTTPSQQGADKYGYLNDHKWVSRTMNLVPASSEILFETAVSGVSSLSHQVVARHVDVVPEYFLPPEDHEDPDIEHATSSDGPTRNMTSSDASPTRNMTSLYLIYRCREGEMCGGWADRLKGIITGFVLAALTGRCVTTM